MVAKKTIVVTGASAGIGYEVVLALARLGNHHIIALASSGEKLKQLQAAVDIINPKVVLRICVFDFNNIANYPALLKMALAGCPKLDILINNVGYLMHKPLESLSIEDSTQLFTINSLAPLHLIQALLPRFVKNAHIVNIGSMVGKEGPENLSGLAAYAANKAALHALSESLAQACLPDPRNIHVNCLALTDLQSQILSQASPDYMSTVTTKAMATEVARFVLSGASLFNGKIIPIAASNP